MDMTNQMRMEQRMKMAPRMIQSMEILQLSTFALLEKIETELNSNPVLEVEEETSETNSSPDPDRSEASPVQLPSQSDSQQQDFRTGGDEGKQEDFAYYSCVKRRGRACDNDFLASGWH